MNNEKLELSLKSIKVLEDEKTLLEEKIKQERSKVFDVLEMENLEQYKSDVATVSYVERKNLVIDEEEVLEEIKDIPKYFTVIPEHKEINKTFKDDVKKGIYKTDAVSMEIKKMPMIRFNKLK